MQARRFAARDRTDGPRVLVAAALALLAAWFFGPAAATAATRARTTADVSVGLTISKVAEGSRGKGIQVQVHNSGPGVASGLALTLDATGLDESKLEMITASGPCGETGPVRRCDLGRVEIPARGNVAIQVWLTHPSGVGPAGSFTATVTAATDDPDPTNNSATRSIEIAGHGPDIAAFGEDGGATQVLSDGRVAGGLLWSFVNTGDATAVGIRIDIALAPNVTFDRHDPRCTYDERERTAQCLLPDLVLGPGENFQPIVDESGVSLVVRTEQRGSFAIPGGTVTGAAIGSSPVEASATGEGTSGPPTATASPTPDVDPGDNGYAFALRVTYATSTQTSPPGHLPITGGRAGVTALVGLAAVALGLVLLLVARAVRRRPGRRDRIGAAGDIS